MSERARPRGRGDFRHFIEITTRWADNDVYGHVNNVIYYSFFDTAVNRYLVEHGGLEPMTSKNIGLVVETKCHYFVPIAFPETVEAGILVTNIGKTSVKYEVGIFSSGGEETAAHGHFIHVYVDAATRRPAELPANLRAAIGRLTKDQ